MKRLRPILIVLATLLLGIVIGGNLFSRTQPRSVIALRRCDGCMRAEDLAGLIGSVAVQKFPGLLPFVVYETDKTIVLKYPLRTGFHFVLVPKKDLKDIGEFSEANAPYLIDIYLVARHLIEENKLSKYSMGTNGPGHQSVTYLHFHLTSDGI